jgi:hypothetical protein
VVLLDHTNVGAENITLPGTAAYNQQRLWILTSNHFFIFSSFPFLTRFQSSSACQ